MKLLYRFSCIYNFVSPKVFRVYPSFFLLINLILDISRIFFEIIENDSVHTAQNKSLKEKNFEKLLQLEAIETNYNR